MKPLNFEPYFDKEIGESKKKWSLNLRKQSGTERWDKHEKIYELQKKIEGKVDGDGGQDDDGDHRPLVICVVYSVVV